MRKTRTWLHRGSEYCSYRIVPGTHIQWMRVPAGACGCRIRIHSALLSTQLPVSEVLSSLCRLSVCLAEMGSSTTATATTIAPPRQDY